MAMPQLIRSCSRLLLPGRIVLGTCRNRRPPPLADTAGDDSADAARGLPPPRNRRSRPGPDPAAGGHRPAGSGRRARPDAPSQSEPEARDCAGKALPQGSRWTWTAPSAPHGRSPSRVPASDRGRRFRPAGSSRDHRRVGRWCAHPWAEDFQSCPFGCRVGSQFRLGEGRAAGPAAAWRVGTAPPCGRSRRRAIPPGTGSPPPPR